MRRIRLWNCSRWIVVGVRRNRIPVDKRYRRKAFAVDLEIEHVKAIVIPDDVVKLLGLDALSYVDFLIEEPFFSESVSLMISPDGPSTIDMACGLFSRVSRPSRSIVRKASRVRL